MAWVEFRTEEQEGGVHAAIVRNADDKPVKDVRKLGATKESIEPNRVVYGSVAVTLYFSFPTQGEVAL
jgi:hypothetical protein